MNIIELDMIDSWTKNLNKLITVVYCFIHCVYLHCRQEAGARGGKPAVGLKLATLVQNLQVREISSTVVSREYAPSRV